uniref:Cortactin n=1 Tax=Sus scrofa TaxID=9823 RepID=A0A8D1KQ14_PIG
MAVSGRPHVSLLLVLSRRHGGGHGGMRGGRTMWLPPPPCRLGLWGLRGAGHWPPRTAAPGLCDATLPFQMWKASAGHTVSIAQDDGGADDWETDPDFVNDVSEKEQRWGAKTVQGSGHQEHINIHKLRENVFQEHQTLKEKELETGPRASHGYGGKFGVEQDRMDKSAVGHEYQSKLSKHCSQVDSVRGFGGKFGVQVDRVDQSAVGFEYQGKTEKHASQKDYASGFGGKYGVQSDRVDKSAVGFDYQGKTEKHESQKDYVKGFGGKFGVQTDRQDKCALGWDHQEKLQLHESQKDYKTGFGGRFGVQSERQDSCAVGFDYKEKLAKHESQQDYSRGFGGKYGVQKDRMDKNASTFEDVAQVAPTYQKTVPVEAVNSKTSNIRANFENLAKEKEQEDRRKAEAERAQRMAKERQEQEEARRQLEEQARAQKPTPPASPTPQPAPERPPSSPVYEVGASAQFVGESDCPGQRPVDTETLKPRLVSGLGEFGCSSGVSAERCWCPPACDSVVTPSPPLHRGPGANGPPRPPGLAALAVGWGDAVELPSEVPWGIGWPRRSGAWQGNRANPPLEKAALTAGGAGRWAPDGSPVAVGQGCPGARTGLWGRGWALVLSPLPLYHGWDPGVLSSSQLGLQRGCVAQGPCPGRENCLPDPSQDAAPLQAEPSYRAPESTHEPEPVYSVEAAGYREACAPEAVYESTEAPGHYPAGAAPALSPLPPFSESRLFPCCPPPAVPSGLLSFWTGPALGVGGSRKTPECVGASEQGGPEGGGSCCPLVPVGLWTLAGARAA